MASSGPDRPDGAGTAVPPLQSEETGRAVRRGLVRAWRQAPDGSAYHRRQADAIAAVAGFAIFAVCTALVVSDAIAGFDTAVFRWVNHWPGWLYPPLWAVQLCGVIGAVVLCAVLAALLRIPRLAVALAAAALLKESLEAAVKTFVHSYRPAQTIPDVIVRRGAAAHGLSFPSGHAMVAFVIAALVAPYLAGRWKILPWALAAVVCLSRVYLGAHFPLEVVAGAGLGLFIAAVLNLTVGVPRGAHSGR
jgi:membrane-associated phospholipid phosphatase